MSTIPGYYIDGHKVVAGHIPGANLLYVMSADTWDFVTFKVGDMAAAGLDDLVQRIEESHREIARVDQQPTDQPTQRSRRRHWWRR